MRLRKKPRSQIENWLVSPDAGTRQMAYNALDQMGDKAVPYLISVIQQENAARYRVLILLLYAPGFSIWFLLQRLEVKDAFIFMPVMAMFAPLLTTHITGTRAGRKHRHILEYMSKQNRVDALPILWHGACTLSAQHGGTEAKEVLLRVLPTLAPEHRALFSEESWEYWRTKAEDRHFRKKHPQIAQEFEAALVRVGIVPAPPGFVDTAPPADIPWYARQQAEEELSRPDIQNASRM